MVSSKHSSSKICIVEGCGKKHEAKGYCVRHYKQVNKYGHVLDNTVADFNVLVDKGTYYEIILTDKYYNEAGRAKFDKEDLDKIKAIGRWTLHSAGYVVNSWNDIYMHRLVMDASSEDYVDHIKPGLKSKSNNRKKNLRICTNAENNWNKDKQTNNISGYKGVFFDNFHNVWKSKICVNGKTKHLGSFQTAEEASKVYQKAAKKLHKDFYYKSKGG